MNKDKTEKSSLHPQNKHKRSYDFAALIEVLPELKQFVFVNKYKTSTINFFAPEAVKALNKAILNKHYNIKDWDIPEGYLCPPIPGRADYILYAADLIDHKKKANVLDIGTGANCIYPLLGAQEYNWTFTASDIDAVALKNAKSIISKNNLQDHIRLVHQTNAKEMFYGVIDREDYFDLSICNPPFFKSHEDAQKANRRKVKNLSKSKKTDSNKNFGGQNNELWCKGGERAFIKKMIKESQKFNDHVNWFTVLVSNNSHLKAFEQALSNVKASDVKIVEMKQGQKVSRILAWCFD